jgi:hypothetical protein
VKQENLEFKARKVIQVIRDPQDLKGPKVKPEPLDCKGPKATPARPDHKDRKAKPEPLVCRDLKATKAIPDPSARKAYKESKVKLEPPELPVPLVRSVLKGLKVCAV